MSNQNIRQEHHRIAGLVPETTQIAESTGTNLGSFAIDQVVEGQFVPLASRHAIEADFSKIDVVTSPTLVEDFKSYRQQLESDPSKEQLREALGRQPEKRRELFTASLYAVGLAKQFFGDNIHDKDKRDEFGWKDLDESRGDFYKLKKLSETADDGVCAEYALVTGEIMKRLAHDVQYTTGYRQDWSDEPSIYHAFLTTRDRSVIIDAFAIAETLNSTKPLGLTAAVEGQSIAQRQTEAVVYKDVFG